MTSDFITLLFRLTAVMGVVISEQWSGRDVEEISDALEETNLKPIVDGGYN